MKQKLVNIGGNRSWGNSTSALLKARAILDHKISILKKKLVKHLHQWGILNLKYEIISFYRESSWAIFAVKAKSLFYEEVFPIKLRKSRYGTIKLSDFESGFNGYHPGTEESFWKHKPYFHKVIEQIEEFMLPLIKAEKTQ